MADAPALSPAPPQSSSRLLRRLLEKGCEFDFFQAVWLLDRYREDQVPVGERGPVANEAFRFRPNVAMGFPASDIHRVAELRGDAGGKSNYRVEVNFMGLYGVSTPLPLHYAIDVLRSTEQSSPTNPEAGEAPPEAPMRGEPDLGRTPLRDFLDIFNHRLISLFYRAWLKYRYDMSYGIPGRDAITDYLLLLVGCPAAFTEETVRVPPLRLIRYAGILTQRPRSGATLEGMLSDYWQDYEIVVEQAVGRWVALSPTDLNSIGLANSRLGVDLTVGEQVYDLSGRFNVVIGPVDWDTYTTFLPGAERHEQTRALVELYCADPLLFNVDVRLVENQVPEMILSSGDRAGRLGFTSWPRTDPIGATSVSFPASSSLAGHDTRTAADASAAA